MISITIVDITSSSVKLQVTGLDFNNSFKRINVSWDDDSRTYWFEDSIQPVFTIEGLQPNHTYNFEIQAYYRDEDLRWQPDPSASENTRTIEITTDQDLDPYYTISYTDTTVTVQAHNTESGTWFHYILVDGSGNQIYDSIDDGHITNNPFTLPVTLTPSTNYGIDRVQYYSSSADELVRIRFTDGNWEAGFTTESGSSPSGDGGYAWIFTGTRWQKAKPYIFDGTRWRPATPYIFDGARWRKCGG